MGNNWIELVQPPHHDVVVRDGQEGAERGADGVVRLRPRRQGAALYTQTLQSTLFCSQNTN